MTTPELFKLITSEHKWYAPYMSAQAAFLFKRRFINGELKESTIKRWFAKFGYVQNEVTWTKSNASYK
jgi:hypothetical protein